MTPQIFELKQDGQVRYMQLIINRKLSARLHKCSVSCRFIFDDEVYGNSEDEKLWMENEILVGDGTLLLHSNEIGDTIGEVKKVSNVQWLSENGS